MSLLDKVFPVGEAVSGIKAVGNILDNLFTSDDERLGREEMMLRLMQAPDKAQQEINKVEAAHRSLFVAGWRPFIGWVCGFGLLWSFIGHPLFEWLVALNQWDIEAPAIITDYLMELVTAMLGLSGLRSFEKLKGRSK